MTGVAAGLHAIVRLPQAVDGLALMRAAARRSVGVYPLGYAYMRPRPLDDGLVLGYANLAEPAIEEGVRRLALALEDLVGGAGRDERRRRDREVVAERPARQAAALEARGRSRWRARLGVIWPTARCAASSQRNLRACASEKARVAGERLLARAAPVEHRAQLAPAGEPEVERRADPLGGERQAVPGRVAGEEHAVLDGAAQLVGDPVALVALGRQAEVARRGARSAP